MVLRGRHRHGRSFGPERQGNRHGQVRGPYGSRVPYPRDLHLVFTIPDSLHELFLAYPRVTHGLFFAVAEQTVREVAANPRNLGAQIGMTAVLRTWTQALPYHPHLQFNVPGGGLDRRGSRRVPARESFFLAVRVLSTVFRGKLLGALENAVASGRIAPLVGGPDVSRLLQKTARHTPIPIVEGLGAPPAA